MKIVSSKTATIDYRTHRNFGLRVWKDCCQIIAPLGSEWMAVGPRLQLPLEVPRHAEDFLRNKDVSNPLSATAFRYELEQPGSDLVAVLEKDKTFEKALQAA
jgi:hypothetical protein